MFLTAKTTEPPRLSAACLETTRPQHSFMSASGCWPSSTALPHLYSTWATNMFTKTPTMLPSWYVFWFFLVFPPHGLNSCTLVQGAATHGWTEVNIEPSERLQKLSKTFLTPGVCSLISAYISCFVYKVFNLRGVADWNPTDKPNSRRLQKCS